MKKQTASTKLASINPKSNAVADGTTPPDVEGMTLKQRAICELFQKQYESLGDNDDQRIVLTINMLKAKMKEIRQKHMERSERSDGEIPNFGDLLMDWEEYGVLDQTDFEKATVADRNRFIREVLRVYSKKDREALAAARYDPPFKTGLDGEVAKRPANLRVAHELWVKRMRKAALTRKRSREYRRRQAKKKLQLPIAPA